MMGLLSGSMESLSLSNKSRRQSDASGTGGSTKGERPDGNENDMSELDKEEGNILMSLISQRMDLSKIALPTFVLEPRSLLERITDFFSHPDLIFGAGGIEDEKERFLKVATYYLSGWHIKPKGVKKPYNPVLGEFFRCTYNYPDGSEGLYIAEQVSHHPPVSAFFYISPANGLLITGELKPKSKFLGNSAATIMEGEDRIRLLDRPQDGEYVITMPNTYARGILFGKMILELGDISSIRNDELEYRCDVDFRTKGWISGGYNVIFGQVKGPDNYHVGDITGHWHDVIEYQDKRNGKSVVFDAKTARNAPKSVLPENQQEPNESRRQWAQLTEAIKNGDMHGATAAKSAVEDKQREQARKREAAGEGLPEARFFRHVAGDKWMPKLDLDGLPEDRAEMLEHVRSWIFAEKKPQSPTTTTSATSPSAPSAPQAVGGGAATSPTATSAQPATGPASPPAATTAPGPPAPGPKLTHPL